MWEVPIASITNGVHLTTWINGDLASLYDQHLQPDWREGHDEPEIWRQTGDIPVERTVGSASPPQAPPGELLSASAPSPAPLARNAPAPVVERAAGSARPRRPDHRLRAPLRHL